MINLAEKFVKVELTVHWFQILFESLGDIFRIHDLQCKRAAKVRRV